MVGVAQFVHPAVHNPGIYDDHSTTSKIAMLLTPFERGDDVRQMKRPLPSRIIKKEIVPGRDGFKPSSRIEQIPTASIESGRLDCKRSRNDLRTPEILASTQPGQDLDGIL